MGIFRKPVCDNGGVENKPFLCFFDSSDYIKHFVSLFTSSLNMKEEFRPGCQYRFE